mmetsp:Transcript_31414/g.86485  ORF Transcript_31414/g.86485 Transcript_31414/m.86485 type:complete len:93 (-) Transcript_31414:458-736(-)
MSQGYEYDYRGFIPVTDSRRLPSSPNGPQPLLAVAGLDSRALPSMPGGVAAEAGLWSLTLRRALNVLEIPRALWHLLNKGWVLPPRGNFDKL